jgi:aminoglycoside phosphotransferase (APT) family kinase protein
MSQVNDQATDPRPGEELPRDRLQAYLGDVMPEWGEITEITQFPGGASNLTYLVRASGGEFILRRPPFGSKAVSAHDMGREYRVMSRLRHVYPYCPEPLAFCDDPSVLGEPFYLMRRLEGIILRRDLPAGRSLSEKQAETLCRRLIDVHLELHQIDFQSAGLADLGRPDGYVQRQVEGWSGRYRAARTDDVPDNEAIMDWLISHMPSQTNRAAVIHNDFKFDNVVLRPSDLGIVGVLDWEMATLGDPLMDLGCSLAYWVEADDPAPVQKLRMLPTHLPGMMTRRQILEHYAEAGGAAPDDFRFYAAFGLFRLAVIVQQIYFRYVRGQTRDPRFADFGGLCSLLSSTANSVVSGQRTV